MQFNVEEDGLENECWVKDGKVEQGQYLCRTLVLLRYLAWESFQVFFQVRLFSRESRDYIGRFYYFFLIY